MASAASIGGSTAFAPNTAEIPLTEAVPQIYGGTTATPDQIYGTVSIAYKYRLAASRPSLATICSGVLLHPEVVMTSAKCVSDFLGHGDELKITGGWTNPSEDQGPPVDVVAVG